VNATPTATPLCKISKKRWKAYSDRKSLSKVVFSLTEYLGCYGWGGLSLKAFYDNWGTVVTYQSVSIF
jgi:hypothetical protein